MRKATVLLRILVNVLSISLAWSKSCKLLCGTTNAYSIIGDVSCQCDHLCEQMDDCCPDFWQECSQKRLMDFESSDEPVLGEVSCEPIKLMIPKPKGLMGVYMVSSCSPNFVPITDEDFSIRANCKLGTSFKERYRVTKADFYLITPVVSQNVTYVNHYCALCNHASGGIVYWQPLYRDFEFAAERRSRDARH